MTGKRILLFTAKPEDQTRGFLEAAKSLDMDLVCVTNREGQPGVPWNDHEISVHFDVPEAAAYAVIEGVRREGVDGILSLENLPAVAAAYAARGLGVAYNHPLAVEACLSRLRMREIFRDAGLLTPWFRKVLLSPVPEPALLNITYPCVLLPMSPLPRQEAIRASDREEFLAAAERIHLLLESAEIHAMHKPGQHDMIVEEYIPGEEIAVEGLLTKGELRILNVFDKSFLGKAVQAMPSRHFLESQAAIERCMVSAVATIGLTHGPVRGEFLLNQNGVWPVQIALGPIEELLAFGPRSVSDANGEMVGFEELLLRHAADC